MADPPTGSIDAFEAMGTAVSMPWLAPEPVSDELIVKVLWAATRAQNPVNSQTWAFVVVRDETTRARLAAIMTAGRDPLPLAPSDSASWRHTVAGVNHLVDHLAEAPVLVFVCETNAPSSGGPPGKMTYSAAFGAAQNLLVAARALGLGAAYTSFHMADEPAVKTVLQIPDEVEICRTLPLGWPERRFGTLNRKPLEDVVHHDRW